MLEWMPPSTAIAAVRVSDIWNHFDSTIFDEMVLLLLGNLRVSRMKTESTIGFILVWEFNTSYGDKVSGGNRRMLEPAISPQDIQQAEFTVDDDSTSLLEGYHIKSFFQLTPSYHIICKNIHPAKQ
ncbi:hypothetical protein M9H77_17632 [Catharanthus roseus]|uniref:Uncharacterized protein n=1 Tax=Catharanthus roseus TaxID=4058 RepID=A0ACC0B578_CATRO|nr:hypothetical protein M9H77_17632 [Catharanthus roseus]